MDVDDLEGMLMAILERAPWPTRLARASIPGYEVEVEAAAVDVAVDGVPCIGFKERIRNKNNNKNLTTTYLPRQSLSSIMEKLPPQSHSKLQATAADTAAQ